MQRSIRKLSLIFGLLLLVHGLNPAVLSAQQTEDNEDPEFVLISPTDGTVIAATHVTITGRVEDASPVKVVAGNIATKAGSDGRFTLERVPVEQGENTIVIVATDEAGNKEEFWLQIIGKDLVPPSVPVVFAVKPTTRLHYQMVEGFSEPESRVVITGGAKAVVADAAYGSGLFTALVQLREGVNDLTVVARDDAGTSPMVRVSIERTGAGTPLPRDGEPSQINISSGAAQRALPGTEFPHPLVALVTDVRGRPVEGVVIGFTVRFGDARFAGGFERQTARTDKSGHASVRLNAGKNFGINLVRADCDGNMSSPAAFDVETIEPRIDKQTSVSGQLLDMFRHPLAGVTVRLGERTIKTGPDGRFKMEKVKPGTNQRVEVFGEDINSGNQEWSDASCPIDVLPGANNAMGRPLFVSPLNEGLPLNAGKPFALDSQGRITSETVAVAYHDDYGSKVVPKILMLQGVRFTATPPAKLEGLKFSATYILSQHVPVTLDDGLKTSLYYFVQPRAVSFDPPLPFNLPNSDRLAPHSRVLVMRYDSRAGNWTKEGTAFVSADAKSVFNDEGTGIRGGGYYAFPSERTHPEITLVDYVQIAGKPDFMGVHLEHVDAYSDGKRAVMASTWGDYGFKRLHIRVSIPVMNGETDFVGTGVEPESSTKPVAVTVTPKSSVLEMGGRLILLAVGRPHPGGYYVWTSADPSIASVEPFLKDGAEHPNRANVVAHRPGIVKISVTYITTAGATSVGMSEVTCLEAKPR